jgi:hypothetical protein
LRRCRLLYIYMRGSQFFRFILETLKHLAKKHLDKFFVFEPQREYSNQILIKSIRGIQITQK